MCTWMMHRMYVLWRLQSRVTGMPDNHYYARRKLRSVMVSNDSRAILLQDERLTRPPSREAIDHPRPSFHDPQSDV